MSGMQDRHPLFDAHLRDWLTMRDVYAGPRMVKWGERSAEYLPPTESMIRDGAKGRTGSAHAAYPWTGTPGEKRYYSYKLRAMFYDFLREGVCAAQGLMHHKPADFQLPASMEGLVKRATTRGESLQFLMTRVTLEQLIPGRVGLLLDLPNQPKSEPQPFVSIYKAENCINWDDGESDDSLTLPVLNLVVLDESDFKRDGYSWKMVNRYRALVLGDPETNEAAGAYRQLILDEDGRTVDTIEPSVRGQKLLELPFVFINAMDHVPAPDDPPLKGLADLALAIYRGDADYRHNLFLQAVKTLVTVGGDFSDDRKPLQIGPEAHIPLPLGASASWVGPSADGLKEQREALNDDKMLAANKAGQLIDTRSGQKEGAETLRIRSGAQTATLGGIVHAAASGVQELLRTYARWIGEDPGKVLVNPNLDFHTEKMSAKELIEFQTAKTMGAPISRRTIHDLMRGGEITTLTLEEEDAELDGEPELPAGPEEDPNADPAAEPEEDEPADELEDAEGEGDE